MAGGKRGHSDTHGNARAGTSYFTSHIYITQGRLTIYSSYTRAWLHVTIRGTGGLSSYYMRLSEICVQRPVFAAMLIMFLIVMGVFSFMGLGLDLFPRTDPATVYVRLRLPGASPEEVTSQVVMPIEEAISSVSGIEEMRAMVSEGSANIIVTFVLEKDIGEASEDVREKVSGAMRELPPNILPPVVQKADPDSDPVITLAVSGDRSIRELTEIADKRVRRVMETVDGVASILISGGQNRQINVFLDLDKLSGYNLTAQDVESALES